MNFHIITIFPESFESYLNSSMLWRAQKEKKAKFYFYNPRDFSKDKHRKVDGRPYGGGPGMVMQVEPILLAVAAARKKIGRALAKSKILITSPSGKVFDNKTAESWAKKYEHLIIICGHYEGIDARVKKILKAAEVSIGPYVLTGGELPAMVIMDAISRRVPGVLGNETSLEEKRISTSEVYTRPEIFKQGEKAYKVPKILLSGHHQNIESWKLKSKKGK